MSRQRKAMWLFALIGWALMTLAIPTHGSADLPIFLAGCVAILVALVLSLERIV